MTQNAINNNLCMPNQDSFNKMSVGQVKEFLSENYSQFGDQDIRLLKNYVQNDNRKGVIAAFNSFLNSKNKDSQELLRVKKLYTFQESIAGLPGQTILGLDEVGRGPLAGPLTVGGVVLNSTKLIKGLNDSKQISADNRIKIAEEIKEQAISYKTFSVVPKYIDELGMTKCLKRAFANVCEQVEKDGIKVDIILLDGNPLGFDAREVNVVKGDSKCASIAAASIIAKVERDQYMQDIAKNYPEYAFDQNKGYGTAKHIQAIKEHGLSPVHRKSFCSSFMQMTLF